MHRDQSAADQSGLSMTVDLPTRPSMARCTPADYAGVWQDFRRTVITCRPANGLRTVPDCPVLGFNGAAQQLATCSDADLDRLQTIGIGAMLQRRMPWPCFATISYNPKLGGVIITIIGESIVEAVGDHVTAVMYTRTQGHWHWVLTGWINDAKHIEQQVNDQAQLADAHLAWHIGSIVVGLLSLPVDIVTRETVSRPISLGRHKAHPLAPSSVLTLSFDPVRVVRATQGGQSQPATHATPSYSFMRRGSTITNKKGTTFHRRATKVMAHLPMKDQVRLVKLTPA